MKMLQYIMQSRKHSFTHLRFIFLNVIFESFSLLGQICHVTDCLLLDHLAANQQVNDYNQFF